MKCEEEGCNGTINFESPVPLPGCLCAQFAYPCNECKRLHSDRGVGVTRPIDDARVFWINDKYVYKEEEEE